MSAWRFSIGNSILSFFRGYNMLTLLSFYFKGLNKQCNFKMVKLKPVELQHCLLNAQICKLYRSLKNRDHMKARPQRKGKNFSTTNHKYLYNIFFSATLRSLLESMP